MANAEYFTVQNYSQKPVPTSPSDSLYLQPPTSILHHSSLLFDCFYLLSLSLVSPLFLSPFFLPYPLTSTT